MKALLLHDWTDELTPSMHRYGVELSAALIPLAARSEIEVDSWQKAQPRVWRRLTTSAWGRRADSALARYAYYPLRCKTLDADFFHILDHGYSQLILGLPAKRTVVTCHDVIPLLAEKGVIDMALPRTVGPSFRFRLRCMRRAARVITDSEATRTALVEHAGMAPERISVIHLGVSETFRPSEDARQRVATRRALDIQDGVKVVLQVGTRGRYKNASLVFHALVNLRSTLRQPVVLVRVGADLRADESDLINRLDLKPHVRSLGRVGGDGDLAALYGAADVLAFPSLWEGFGWPPLEAMACGLPVVVSDRGALPEVVGDAALIVDAGDHRALAEALGRIFTDEGLRRDMVRRGLQRARTFTWSACAAKTLQVYCDVMHGASGRGERATHRSRYAQAL